MKTGVVFPQTEIGQDPGAVLAFAQAAEGLGYDHLVVYDHVVGADPANRPDWAGPYTHQHLFHEPFVLFGYLAAVTTSIELVTGILILPQRQTALVAKQAAEVDRLSGGRLRLGVAVGWNPVEYEALGEDFHNRGVRIEEQLEVLRALWTDEVVTFHGKWHHITEAGINPMPVQRPIPIWFGGGKTEAVVKRIARLGDGWFPQVRPDDTGRAALEQFRQFAREAGRDPTDLGIETRVKVGSNGEELEQALRDYSTWNEMAVTHVSVNTMGHGFKTADDHIEAIQRFKEALNA
jgi:probable F420-dependent oxidoreductase